MKGKNRRVKIYMLSSDGVWMDKGTGYLTIVFQEV